MTWQVAVRHSTRYTYTRSVVTSYNEARMTPASGHGQQTLQARLEVLPRVQPLRYRDYWGTVVDAFDVHVPHTELMVTATSVVETAGVVARPAAIGWSELDPVRDRYSEFLAPSRFAMAEPDVIEVGSALAGRCDPAEAGRRAALWVHDALTYTKGVTGVLTTSAEARALGKGVCQDYAHLTLAVARAAGLPSRYVSGYLLPERDAEIGATARGESHAWVEYWAGAWLPVDPTSLADVGERHVVVARGRDYADVRPLSGVYHGAPAGPIYVTVELTRLR